MLRFVGNIFVGTFCSYILLHLAQDFISLFDQTYLDIRCSV